MTRRPVAVSVYDAYLPIFWRQHQLRDIRRRAETKHLEVLPAEGARVVELHGPVSHSLPLREVAPSDEGLTSMQVSQRAARALNSCALRRHVWLVVYSEVPAMQDGSPAWPRGLRTQDDLGVAKMRNAEEAPWREDGGDRGAAGQGAARPV